LGPNDPDDCVRFFNELWKDQVKWLDEKLAASTADWQIVVTHYPPTFSPLSETWQRLSKQYGIDLFIVGHRHQMELHYQEWPFGDTAWVVAGGGGGCTSEGTPNVDGHDSMYGFVDFKMSKEKIDATIYSHGGLESKTVAYKKTFYPRMAANMV